MLLPDDDRTNYLRDGFYAWRRYWSHQRQSYWPKYTGVKVGWWDEWKFIVYGVVAGFVFVFFVVR